ncbi:MAG: ABC-type transport auxiliary lipoprotein family protein [Campylobacterota bacterium]|nr:ABC-type transport auxiliary lipoprotein family protein [Campylobacterota bacterium]
MKKTVWVVALASLFILGCSSKEVVVKTYTLHTAEVSKVFSGRYRTKTLKISFPQTRKEKLSSKIRYSYSLSEEGTYLNSQWSNNLGKLLQGTFMNALSQSQVFYAVLPYASSAGVDYRLESSVIDFSHHVRGSLSYAIVSIQFSLINTDTGRLIKSKKLSYKEFTSTIDAKGYVEATTKILGRLNSDLVVWLRD